MENENSNEEITWDDIEEDSKPPAKTCKDCRRCKKVYSIRDKKLSDFCDYRKFYLNGRGHPCRYFSDVKEPPRNFEKELGRGHTVGKGFATFDD
jgi:hypothetical protein